MFSDNLKNLRLRNRMTQKQLAQKMNVSTKTISHWESGYSFPSVSAVKKLKKILNVTYEQLLDK